MITYEDFIKVMEEKGNTFTHKRIDNGMMKIFPLKKDKTGKFLELICHGDDILALCGTEHVGGCANSYLCNIKLTNNNDDEPFQKMHQTTVMKRNQHVVAEIVVTKILQQEPPLDNKKVKEWSEKIAPILQLIGSENRREHVMWVGAYPKFNSEFIKNSFTLYGGQKMIFYAVNPDIDITNIIFEMEADIFSKK